VTTPSVDPAPVDPGAAGERIERLLEAMSAAGPVARDRAEELVRVVVELYGAGLERLLDIAHESGALDASLLDALTADPLVSALLLVHDLHPDGLEARVRRALAGVGPELAAHEGHVELMELDGVGTVRLRLVAGGTGCGASPSALTATVEQAVRAAAPEVVDVRVDIAPPEPTVIPIGQLTAHLRAPQPAIGSA
jgi:Fe-S cluster biogenesis protein NfuA